MLKLNFTWRGVAQIVFKRADDNRWLPLEMDHVGASLNHAGRNAKQASQHYGRVSRPNPGAVQHALLQLGPHGGRQFFSEAALDLADLVREDRLARGIILVPASNPLILEPRLYSTFLLWPLSERFEQLREDTQATALRTRTAARRDTLDLATSGLRCRAASRPGAP